MRVAYLHHEVNELLSHIIHIHMLVSARVWRDKQIEVGTQITDVLWSEFSLVPLLKDLPIHIHIHMLVSARVWRDKQIAMPGALRSRSFWLRAAAGLSFLGPLVPITTKEVSWLTPPPGE